jgi:hypothetical protein
MSAEGREAKGTEGGGCAGRARERLAGGGGKLAREGAVGQWNGREDGDKEEFSFKKNWANMWALSTSPNLPF